MRLYRRLVNVQPSEGRRFLTVGIPASMAHMFSESEMVIIEQLPEGSGPGIVVRPAGVYPIIGD